MSYADFLKGLCARMVGEKRHMIRRVKVSGRKYGESALLVLLRASHDEVDVILAGSGYSKAPVPIFGEIRLDVDHKHRSRYFQAHEPSFPHSNGFRFRELNGISTEFMPNDSLFPVCCKGQKHKTD